jgi:hypothetical protein
VHTAETAAVDTAGITMALAVNRADPEVYQQGLTALDLYGVVDTVLGREVDPQLSVGALFDVVDRAVTDSARAASATGGGSFPDSWPAGKGGTTWTIPASAARTRTGCGSVLGTRATGERGWPAAGGQGGRDSAGRSGAVRAGNRRAGEGVTIASIAQDLAGQFRFLINSRSGREVWRASGTGAGEVAFPPGTRFKVVFREAQTRSTC